MQNLVTVMVILGTIGVGVLLIPRRDGRRGDRAVAFRPCRTAPGGRK